MGIKMSILNRGYIGMRINTNDTDICIDPISTNELTTHLYVFACTHMGESYFHSTQFERFTRCLTTI